MSIINTIYKKYLDVKYTFTVKTNLTPYIKAKEQALTSLSAISEEVPTNVKIILDNIKTNKLEKFFPICREIEDITNRIKEHNKVVIKLENYFVNFNYNKYILDPSMLTSSIIADFNKILRLLNNYRTLPNKYINYKKEISDLANNEDVIKKQFSYLALYEKVFKLKNQYIDYYEKTKLLDKLTPLISLLNNSNKTYYDFSKINNIDNIIKKHNEEYIKNNLDIDLFDDILGKSLDREQRRAILEDEINELVIAGAGSGKTLTICGKVKYLLENKNVSPSDILLLSYSKKSAEDLEEKIAQINENIKVGTFHKLGLDILKLSNDRNYVVEDQFDYIIENYFKFELVHRPEYMKKILMFISLYLKNNKNNVKYKDTGELYSSLKNEDYSTLKDLVNSSRKLTIKKELVKSYEELVIANYYFINGINYTYEKTYEINTETKLHRQYTPDFYLDDYNIYHEHYGVNRNGECLQYKDDEAREYIKSMNWKKNLHEENKTTCIESYSYEFQEGIFFNKLEEKLKEYNVKKKPLNNTEISNAINSIYNTQNFKSFINLVKSFINLYKARYDTELEFSNFRKKCNTNSYQDTRTRLFLEIAENIYLYYKDYVRKEDRIDFDDMIFLATKEINKVNDFNYKYIIVDEFQDISYSRMKFLQALLNKGKAKLFGVGDDFQAIYRFAGCDLNIFLNFKKYFSHAKYNYITTTHRNSRELQKIACDFICKNDEQFKKAILSNKSLINPIKLCYYENDKIKAFKEVVNKIAKENNKANILVLVRNNFDINSILDDRNVTMSNKKIKVKDYPDLNIKYSTVHSAKGLEEDYVILINAENGVTGFPNKIEDDVILDLVLGKDSTYLYAEERRLWYVALTRTRSYLYILVNQDKPSIFIDEIKNYCERILLDSNTNTTREKLRLCPKCKSGHLVRRDNFYGCSNYPYCKYSVNIKAVEENKKCPYCGDYLVLRKGKYGTFYGCNSYPKCNYTKNISNNRDKYFDF